MATRRSIMRRIQKFASRKLKDHVNSRGMKFNDLFSNYLADPTNQNAKDRVQERIIEALIYLNTTEEFHLI